MSGMALYSEFVYLEYRNRFHNRLEAINGEAPYDSEAAERARKALVERQRRIESTSPAMLTYDEFLDSLYWVCLSDWVKYQANYRCQCCGVRPRSKRGWSYGRGLNVHHKTYAHRGFEYPEHLDDLEVLCRACHSRRHGHEGPSDGQETRRGEPQ